MILDMAVESDGTVSVIFRGEKDGYSFFDRILLSADEYAKLKDDGVSVMAQKRFDDWYTHITSTENTSVEE